MLASLDANYTAGVGPMSGVLSYRSSPAAGAVTLDLANLPERLWATELATLFQTAQDAGSEKRRWCAPLCGSTARVQAHARSHRCLCKAVRQRCAHRVLPVYCSAVIYLEEALCLRETHCDLSRHCWTAGRPSRGRHLDM